ncbi:DUF4202 domain-containing protein [Aestuariicella hydrocarbonica]|uniref:DUF4202 domain-containing protein n=1 Tax=Pseudomaricurvus hydrocarbonicus TaxID=1470433 RepID=A0A9E5MMV8_9GAMM|nr:DUF4202 domain-containing protein [Aestuariicella hydrocarbonica]NHO67137.1 DUF4202 domain-containing protein [Aestuariicella hydrocarbonica]
MTQHDRLSRVLDAIDQKNRQDPHSVVHDGNAIAKELLYGQRMSQRLADFQPDASEFLQIACRAQHIQRWSIPRKDYPMDRPGYKRWRTDLAKFHADLTAELMSECGYNEEEKERVKNILQKKQLKRDPEAQTMEDIACLVFLEFHLEEFAAPHDEEKVIDIIRKTWNKMSDNGHAAALKLPLSETMGALIGRALND